jgi:hypothetical protein
MKITEGGRANTERAPPPPERESNAFHIRHTCSSATSIHVPARARARVSGYTQQRRNARHALSISVIKPGRLCAMRRML